jgi:sigma-B regulation protein RsbU (phosphoserine phosphatase)
MRNSLPVPRTSSLEVPANLSVLRQASGWLESQAKAWLIPEEVLERLDLCLNEVIANCVTHGGPYVSESPLALQLSSTQSYDQKLITLSVSDGGMAFDPTASVPKPLAPTLALATPGGLGIVMMRKSATRLSYQRASGRNHIDILFQFEDTSLVKAGRLMKGEVLPFQIPLFKDAGPQALHAVLRECLVLEIPANTPLLIPGQNNGNVYIALSGTVVAHLGYQRRPEAPVTIALGQCIGELSAIDGKPVSTLVMATTDARVLRIPQEIFWGDLMALNGVAANFRIILSDRVRKSKELALQAQRGQMEIEQLTKELQIARQLQISMVPLQRPLFGHRTDLDVCGFMEPASAVGGDFFDAFFVRENHLFFCIADVSGHGIASALFMARALGLIRVLAMGSMEPHALLSELNARLCSGNDANIFVTMFCGVLDVSKRRLVYSNAGHCAPMLLYPGSSRMLPIPKGPLVGAFAGVKFSAMELQLGPEETLFCYTDGVTEARNSLDEELTEERCLEMLNSLQPQSAANLVDFVREQVADFSGTTTLEDDCTMLAIRLL